MRFLVKMLVQINAVLAASHNHIQITTKIQDYHHSESLETG